MGDIRQVLKYPGSKWNLSRKLVKMIPEHHTYCEPYAGSMALLFTKDPSPIEVVNDLDSDVVNLFQCIQQDSERLARLVMTTPYSREVYDSQFSGSGYASRYQRAAGFLIKCWQGHGFTMAGRQIRFILPLPERQAKEYWYTPGRGQRRTDEAAHAAWEQACRARWRALYLIIKAKLEAVEAGISTVEREFLYDIVLPDGRTAGEWMVPQITEAYETGRMPDMLPMIN